MAGWDVPVAVPQGVEGRGDHRMRRAAGGLQELEGDAHRRLAFAARTAANHARVGRMTPFARLG